MIFGNFKIFKLKDGFTLAEALIALVVVGVVAALTIPSAINKFKERTTIKNFIFKMMKEV